MTVELLLVFILLFIYQIKHLLADYFLQNRYMLGKFKPGWDFFLPLTTHAGVHGASTLAICLLISPKLWWLSLVDFSVHFIMDRIKAGPKYLGRFKPLTSEQFKDAVELVDKPEYTGRTLKAMQKEAKLQLRHNTYFWWSLGFDQMIHHLTDLFVIYIIIMNINKFI